MWYSCQPAMKITSSGKNSNAIRRKKYAHRLRDIGLDFGFAGMVDHVP
jgi:hypothetical protein